MNDRIQNGGIFQFEFGQTIEPVLYGPDQPTFQRDISCSIRAKIPKLEARYQKKSRPYSGLLSCKYQKRISNLKGRCDSEKSRIYFYLFSSSQRRVKISKRHQLFHSSQNTEAWSTVSNKKSTIFRIAELQLSEKDFQSQRALWIGVRCSNNCPRKDHPNRVF